MMQTMVERVTLQYFGFLWYGRLQDFAHSATRFFVAESLFLSQKHSAPKKYSGTVDH